MNRNLTLNRWSPAVFGDVRREVDRLLHGYNDEEDRSPFFAPQADFAETERGYELSLDLPGMTPEDVEIESKDGHLWISGERPGLQEESGKTYHRVERTYGKFRRVIALGNEIDADNVEANYKDGVLTVLLPKVEKVLPKRIAVNS